MTFTRIARGRPYEIMAIIKEKKIKITSIIENADTPGEEISETNSNGFLKISDTHSTIEYVEEGEGGKTATEITVEEGKITVKKRGAVNSDMCFSEGLLHKSVYGVPPFSFDTTVKTRKIRSSLTKEGGKIDIYYDMSIGGADKKVKLRIEL